MKALQPSPSQQWEALTPPASCPNCPNNSYWYYIHFYVAIIKNRCEGGLMGIFCAKVWWEKLRKRETERKRFTLFKPIAQSICGQLYICVPMCPYPVTKWSIGRLLIDSHSSTLKHVYSIHSRTHTQTDLYISPIGLISNTKSNLLFLPHRFHCLVGFLYISSYGLASVDELLRHTLPADTDRPHSVALLF